MGDKLYHCRFDSRCRLHRPIYLPSSASQISAYAADDLAISAVPSSHCHVFLGIHYLCGCISIQLYTHVAARFWQKCRRGMYVRKYLLTIGCNLEYTIVGDGTFDQLRRVLYLTSRIRDHPAHSRRDRHSRRRSSPSFTFSRCGLLGDDFPIPPTHDHGSRILISRLFSLRSRIGTQTSSLSCGRSIHVPYVARLCYRCCCK